MHVNCRITAKSISVCTICAFNNVHFLKCFTITQRNARTLGVFSHVHFLEGFNFFDNYTQRWHRRA